MGTYKHIGRLRCARLVGLEVASFYTLLGETQKAAAFLTDALRAFEQDGWRELAAHAQLRLADCFRTAGDGRRLVGAAVSVAAASEMDTLVRWTYFDEMRRWADGLEEALVLPFNEALRMGSVGLRCDGALMQDAVAEAELVLESNFPREVSS